MSLKSPVALLCEKNTNEKNTHEIHPEITSALFLFTVHFGHRGY